MVTREKFHFPILTIQKIRPLLQKDERVFAYEIKSITEKSEMHTMYENKGLDLGKYIGKEMQCLLEITRGQFHYLNEFDKKPSNISEFKYLWHKRLYEYFPDLVKISDDLDEAYSTEEDSIQEIFESTATRVFKDWGLNGLEMGIYQAKPLLSSPHGFYFLNEYEFEDEIEELELNEKVYIEIKEIYLRGIRPYLPHGKEYRREEKIEPEQKEGPEQKGIPSEAKKSKFSFLG